MSQPTVRMSQSFADMPDALPRGSDSEPENKASREAHLPRLGIISSLITARPCKDQIGKLDSQNARGGRVLSFA